MTVDATTVAHLRQLEERLLHPEVRSSPGEVAALLDESFVEFGQSGTIYDKQSILAALQDEASGARPGGSWTLTGFAAKALAPGVVLVTFRLLDAAKGRAPRESLRSSIWKQHDGGWRIVFHQGTTRPGG